MKKKNKKNVFLPNLNDFIAEDTIDFHEFGEMTTAEIEQYLLEFLEDSHINGYENVLVITGKGKVVKPLVNNLLKKNKFVKEFKTANYFNGNDGAFEVKLS